MLLASTVSFDSGLIPTCIEPMSSVESLSLVSILKARMADLVLVLDADGLDTKERAQLDRVIEQVRPLCDDVLE